MSPTHYRGSIGDVFYLIPFKKIPIPGIPIDVAAVNLLFFAITIYLIITCNIPVFYVKYCRKRENIIWVKQVTLKQPIQILYYLAQLQMTSNNM